MSEKLMTRAEAASFIGVSSRGLKKYIDSGELTSVKKGRKVVFPFSEVRSIRDGLKYPIPADGEIPIRYHLPEERKSVTRKIRINDFEAFLTVGLFRDGSPAEVFLDMTEKDTQFAGLADQWCTALSMLFQYGVPHEDIYDKFALQKFAPEGITNLSEIPICKSIVDLIIRYLKLNYPPTKKEDQDDYDKMVSL